MRVAGREATALSAPGGTCRSPADGIAVNGGARIAWRATGIGPTVLFLPGGGRAAADFEALAATLAGAGFRCVLPDPRGTGASSGPLAGLSVADLLADVLAVIDAAGGGPVTVVGHAFGGRLARLLAARHPATVAALVLLGAGGRVPPAPAVVAAMQRGFDPGIGREERRAALRTAWFAAASDPSAWESGWYPAAMQAQQAALAAVPVDAWWTGGNAPLLVLQGAEDAAAPPANAAQLAHDCGDRLTLLTLEGAGHALLPEQPAAIAAAIIAWLRRDALPAPGTARVPL